MEPSITLVLSALPAPSEEPCYPTSQAGLDPACRSATGTKSTPSPFPRRPFQIGPPFHHSWVWPSPLFNQTIQMWSIKPTHSLRNTSPPWKHSISKTSCPQIQICWREKAWISSVFEMCSTVSSIEYELNKWGCINKGLICLKQLKCTRGMANQRILPWIIL